MYPLALAAMILLAVPAWAQTLRNESGALIDLHGGPADWYPVVARLGPGGQVELGRCDLDGRWCLATVDYGLGWIDTTALDTTVPPAPPPEIVVTPIPSAPGAAPPLPPEILEAIPAPAPMVPPVIPGARPPMMLSVSEPLRNVTDAPIDIRAGPGADRAVVGRLAPGEGGVIDICDAAERWCRVTPETGPRGWVETTMMGLRPKPFRL
ncbi:MAG: SH3 domain-containing protein [Pseudomonadota bacterium]